VEEIDDTLQKACLWMTKAWNDHNKRNWTVQVGLSYNRLTIKYELVFSFVKINTRLNLFSY
jgi:hypothetical protein